MKKLFVLLAVALAAISVTAAPTKKPTKPVATKKAPAKKAVAKKAPPTTSIRPEIVAPPKVQRKAVLSKGKKK